MFQLVKGNLFECQAEALVNTVNTEGIMGKGVALQFRHAFPEMYRAYKRACQGGTVQIGKMHIFKLNSFENPRYIINFPTKRSWRSKSNLRDIQEGLTALVVDVRRLGIKSVAVPPLGCGLGGLSWLEVQHHMRLAFEGSWDVNWIVYEPVTNLKESIPIQTMPLKMTKGRAVLIELITRYLVPGFDYEISLLEIQKLVYFMTEAGEELRNVVFIKGPYGPYADVLRHVLEKLEGHYTHGYISGGNKPESPIKLLPNVAAEAQLFLEGSEETKQRFKRVSDLITGFETPFGMELLSTVHWIATRECDKGTKNLDEVFSKIKTWNSRKATLMSKEQVEAALGRLVNHGWLNI